MKTLILLFTILSAGKCFASGGDDAREKLKATMTSDISAQLSYRDMTSQMGEGFAFAEITVDELGHVKVLHVNASNAERRAILQSHLESLDLKVPTEFVGKAFAFKLEFHRADS